MPRKYQPKPVEEHKRTERTQYLCLTCGHPHWGERYWERVDADDPRVLQTMVFGGRGKTDRDDESIVTLSKMPIGDWLKALAAVVEQHAKQLGIVVERVKRVYHDVEVCDPELLADLAERTADLKKTTRALAVTERALAEATRRNAEILHAKKSMPAAKGMGFRSRPANARVMQAARPLGIREAPAPSVNFMSVQPRPRLGAEPLRQLPVAQCRGMGFRER